MDTLELLQELVSIPGPPGQEEPVTKFLQSKLSRPNSVDAKGNLLVTFSSEQPKVIVTAHMDEIAMIVTDIQPDGQLKVTALGGLHAWKLGEGPVQILSKGGPLNGVLSFGGVHTEDPSSTIKQAEESAPEWDLATVFTGQEPEFLFHNGVRPGTRVVVHPSRRQLTPLGELISGYFLDDRADLVAWLLAIEAFKKTELPVIFAATTSEEVGGEGAQYLLHKHQPNVCIALELGPSVPDSPVEISDQPTVWVTDSYASMKASDGDLIAELGEKLGMDLQFQALSRGGSDASCAASRGLCARPITLGLPMENTHGYEIIHPGSIENLATLTVALVKELCR